MTPQAQATLVLGGTGAAVAGGYGATYITSGNDNEVKEESKRLDTNEPTQGITTIALNQLDSSQYTGNLITLFQESNLSKLPKTKDVVNKSWWEWALRNKYQANKVNEDNLSEDFKGITIGFSDKETDKALNNACEKAYLRNKEEYKFKDSYLLKNINDYCTKGTGTQDVSKPKYVVYGTPSPSQEYSDGVLSVDTNREHLVKHTKDQDNNYWWLWVYEQHKETIKTSSSFFNVVTEGFTDTDTTTSIGLNNKCNEAYKQNLEALNINTSLIDEIKRFCSTQESNVSITKPLSKVVEIKEPTENVSVFSDSLDSTYSDNKLIGVLKHKDKFVKPTGESNTESWWTWSFTERFDKRNKGEDSTKLHDLFKEVDKAFNPQEVTTEGDKQKALNQACDKAYKKSKSDYLTDENLLKNLIDYCAKKVEASIDLTEPTPPVSHEGTTDLTKNETTKYKDGLLNQTDNRSKLVKDVTENEQWWRWVYKSRVGSDKSSYPTQFQSVTTYSSSGDTNAINKICDTQYQKNSEELKETANLLDYIKKLCTIDGESTTEVKEPIEVTEPAKANIKYLNSDNAKPTDKGQTYYNAPLIKETTNQSKLVDPDKSENKEFWKWKYHYKYNKDYKQTKATLPDPFKSVTEGYSDGNFTRGEKQTSLNKACKEAYLKNKKSLDGPDSGKKLLETIKEFCTHSSETGNLTPPDQPSYTTLKDIEGELSTKYPDAGLLKKENNKEKLVDPDNGENEEWWEHKFENEYPKKGTEPYGKLSSVLNNLTKGYSGQESDKNVALNQACKEAYKEKSNESLNAVNDQNNQKKLFEEIAEYCAVKGTAETVLELEDDPSDEIEDE